MSDDIRFMRRALALAEPGLGRVWPNPSVGCLLVNRGEVVGEARTADGGRPHAEPLALAQAGQATMGATAYVSLEPCSHVGETSPCTEALIAAKVTRVLVAVCDPDPRVNGRGIAQLRGASVEVEVGLLAAKAAQMNAGFFQRIQTGQPLIHALDSGAPPPEHGYDAHLMAQSDIANGALNRHLTSAAAAVRILVAPTLDEVAKNQLGTWSDEGPTWLVSSSRRDDLPTGVELIVVDDDSGDAEPVWQQGVVDALGNRGLTRVLTGGRLSAWATEES